MRIYFFGCWNRSGHFLWTPDGQYPGDGYSRLEYWGNHVHLDANLAPRRTKRTGGLCWAGMGDTTERRQNISYGSEELPQGQFLLHHLDTGFTAIQWWDRQQGDQRGACNSTLLLEGRHDAAAMTAALEEHFPHVVANLRKAGVELVDVTPCNEAGFSSP